MNICPGRLIGLAEKQWSVDMAYKSVNPYNGKVLRTFDDMTNQTRLCG